MPLQGVEFQAVLFLIVCINAVPNPDLEIVGGGGGGAPLDSPRQKLGFSSRIGYYIHWNLSSGMKIRVSTFFSIPTTGGKIVRTLSFNGVHVTLENKKIHIRPLPPSIPSLGLLLLLSGSSTSSTTLHRQDGGGRALFSLFKKCPQLILLPIVA